MKAIQPNLFGQLRLDQGQEGRLRPLFFGNVFALRIDPNGFAFWFNKLQQLNGDFRRAEMVKAFIISGEYRARFAR